MAQLGIDAQEVLDLSVNVNPYGPCDPLLEAIRNAPLDRYPDPSAFATRGVLARALGVDPDRLVIGNGAAELLWLLARVGLTRGSVFASIEPTFSEMRRAASRVGATWAAFRLSPEYDFEFEPKREGRALERFIELHAPALLYACSPGNPCGRRLPIDFLGELAEQFPRTHFVVDISFDSLSEGPPIELARCSPRMTWVCSLTKDLALPGLRLGYCLLPPSWAERLEAERPPWSVNAAAQAAVRVACTPEVTSFVRRSQERLRLDRAFLHEQLEQLGLRVHGSVAPYCLAKLPDPLTATALRSELLEHHRILVRDASSFALPHHVRVAARPAEQALRLVSALSGALRTLRTDA